MGNGISSAGRGSRSIARFPGIGGIGKVFLPLRKSMMGKTRIPRLVWRKLIEGIGRFYMVRKQLCG